MNSSLGSKQLSSASLRGELKQDLKSGDLATTQSGLTRAIKALNKQEDSIWRLKLALGASLVAILGLGGYLATKTGDKSVAEGLAAELARDTPDSLILQVLEEKGWRQMTQDELLQLQIKHDISEGGAISVEEWLQRARAKIIEGNKN